MVPPFEFSGHSNYSTEPYFLPTPKLPKRPIYNPYDKFTQPEFDAWIGGITSALRQALGQEDAEEQPSHNPTHPDVAFSGGPNGPELFTEEEESMDEEVNDSFAEIKARRVLGKGKARDPRDGPGFGTGEKNKPIEIGSDTDEGDQGEGDNDGEGSEEWNEEEQSEEEEDQLWDNGESSVQAQMRHEREVLDAGYEDEYESEGADENGDGSDRAEEEGGYDENELLNQRSDFSPILILSDEEKDGSEGEHSPVHDEYIDEQEYDISYSDEDEQEVPSILVPQLVPVVAYHSHVVGTSTKYSHEHRPMETTECHEDIDNVQETRSECLAEDISLPPQTLAPDVSQSERSLILRNTLDDSKEHGNQDTSNNGVHSQPSGESITNHEVVTDGIGLPTPGIKAPVIPFPHLGNRQTRLVDENVEEEELTKGGTSPHPAATVSVIADDSIETLRLNMQLGSEGHSTGDVCPGPDARELDGAFTHTFKSIASLENPSYPESRVDHIDVDSWEDDEQPMDKDTSFPPSTASPSFYQVEYPVDIPDPWDGPAKYAEDYYSGGDVRHEPGIQLIADHLGDEADTSIFVNVDDTVDSRNIIDSHMEGVARTAAAPLDSDVNDEGPDHANELYEYTDKIAGDVQSKEQSTEEHFDTTNMSSVPQSTAKPVLERDAFNLDNLYDDIQIGPFNGIGDGQTVDWNYHSAFLNGLATSTMDQIVAPPASPGEGSNPTRDKNEVHDVGIPSDKAGDEPDVTEVDMTDNVQGPGVVTSKVITDDAELAIGIDQVPTVGASSEAIEEAVVPEASIFAASTEESSLVQFQTLYPPQAQQHQHEFGLPTPPSEEGDMDLPPTSHQRVANSSPLIVEVSDQETIPPECVESQIGIADIGAADDFTNEEQDSDVDGYRCENMDTTSSITPVPSITTRSHAEPITQGTIAQIEPPSNETLTECEPLPVELPTEDSHSMTIYSEQVCEEQALSEDTGSVSLAVTSNLMAEGDLETVQWKGSMVNVDKPTIFAHELSPHAPPPQQSVGIPICADSTNQPRTPPTESLEPLAPSLPGTPNFALNSVSTSAGRPTPVLLATPPVLHMQHPIPATSSTYPSTHISAASRGTTPKPAADQNEDPAVPMSEENEATLNPTKILTNEMLSGEPTRSDPFMLPEPSTEKVEEFMDIPIPHNSKIVSTQAVESSGTTLEELSIAEANISIGNEKDGMDSQPPVQLEGTPSQEHTYLSLMVKPPVAYNAPSSAYPMRVVMRKATDPVLFSDPYPYSLSTPGDFVDITKDIQDEVSDEDTEQDNSISSSSTFDKDLVENENKIIPDSLNHDDVLENTELQYPPLQPDSLKALEDPTEKATTEENDFGSDTDADGDLDPDFVTATHGSKASPVARQSIRDHPKTVGIKPAIPTEAAQRGTKNQTKQDTEQLRSTLSTEHVTGSSGDPHSKSLSSEELPAILIIKKPTARNKRKEGEDNSELMELDEIPNTPIKPKASRPSKRKRSSPVTVTSPLTRSTSTKRPENTTLPSGTATDLKYGIKSGIKTTNGRSLTSKDKGKHKETREAHTLENFDTRSISSRSSSGISSAARMLYPDSRTTSRASSIVSSTPSDKSSLMIQPSPTLDKGATNFRPQLPPPPLLHRHSHALPHHRPPSMQPQRQLSASKTSSSSLQTNVSSVPESTAPRPSTSSQPSSHRVPTYTSPVTRSNCRYHKISIPREEDGPRIYFLVPGCSLGDRELIEEEEIKDHGDATPEDGRRIVQDLDSLAFDPYLIGVLRLLVGVDLLREQEVYYLPQAGEELVPKRRLSKAEKSTTARTSSRDTLGSTDHTTLNGSPRTSLRSPTLSKAPVSAAGSSSTSASVARRVKEPLSSDFSFTDSEFSEEDVPDTKRAKPSPIGGKASTGSMGPPASHHKKGTTKGVKRNREAVKESDSDARKGKKQKTTMTEQRSVGR